MATQEQVDAALGRLNAATTAAGAKITSLKDQLAQALADKGLSGGAEDALLAQLGQVADALTAMAADVADPVPVPVPGEGDEEPTPGDETEG